MRISDWSSDVCSSDLDSGSVTLNGVRVESKAASITSQLTQSDQTQDITIGSGSALKINNGNLLQVNRTTAGMDGVVTLTLEAGSTSAGNIVDLDGLNPGGSGRSEEHTSELQSLMRISYAVFCLQKK